MKKLLLLTSLIGISVVGVACSSDNTKADTPSATYIQSDDKDGIFDRIVIVDKETGCKYLGVVEYAGGRSSITPMYQPDGKPLCN